jgi:hypothetical protein
MCYGVQGIPREKKAASEVRSFPKLFVTYSFRVVDYILNFYVRSINNQHYALICTTPLFYILAPTCFGSSLPSSESFLDPSELLEMQIE